MDHEDIANKHIENAKIEACESLRFCIEEFIKGALDEDINNISDLSLKARYNMDCIDKIIRCKIQFKSINYEIEERRKKKE